MQKFLSRIFFASAVIFLLAGFLSAEQLGEIILFHHLADWGGARPGLAAGKEGELILQRPGDLIRSTDPIDIDLSAESTFSGEFRRQKGAPEDAAFFFGLICYDQNMRRIYPQHVNPIANSESELSADCTATDTGIQVRDGSQYVSGCLIAFHTLPQYADLPNFTINSKAKVQNIRKLENGTHELILSEPIGRDAKKGTPIRAHQSGGSPYLYAVAFAKHLSEEWTPLAATLKGARPGDIRNAWYPGTRFASPAIFCSGKTSGQLIGVRNVQFESKNGNLPPQRKSFDLSGKTDHLRQNVRLGEELRNLILHWQDGSRTKLTFSTFLQKYTPAAASGKDASQQPAQPRELPLSGISLSKTGIHCYIRPNLEILPAAKIPELVEQWDQLPNPLQHIGRLDVVRVAGGAEIWYEGYYGGCLSSASPLKTVQLDSAICVGEAVLFQQQQEAARFVPLYTTRKNNSDKWQVSECQVEQRLLPVPMEFSEANFALSRNRAENYADYIRRYAMDNDPDSYLFSVPGCFYRAAWILFGVAEEAQKKAAMTARLTRFSRGGQWNGRAITRMAHTPYEFSPENALKVGSCVVNGKRQSLYLAHLPLASGQLQDLLNYDQYGSKMPGQYLDFELTGPLLKIRHPFGDSRMKPDPATPSSLHVFGVTLEKAGAEMFVRPLQPGNIFHNQEIPELLVDFKAQLPGQYQLRWTIRNPEGEIVTQDYRKPEAENRISLQQPLPGYYEINIELLDQGQVKISHLASFALLGKDTREATPAQSPYGSWWFTGAHHVSGDPELIGPLYLKAGIRKSNSLRPDNPLYTEAGLAKWKMTATTFGFWRRAFTMFDTESDPAVTNALIEKELRTWMEAFPSCSNAMIFHESAKWGYQIAPEVLGDPAPEKEWDGADERFAKAKRYAEIVRRTKPELRIMIGNSLSCSELVAELFRRNFPKELGDNLGMEVVSRNALPERQWEGSLQACELMQLAAQHYGYDWKPTSCFESNYRLESLIGDELQAYWYVRDMLVMHAWNFPDINVALMYDVANNYYHSFWGGSGLCQRVPYLYPKKAYVGVATLTRMLDRGKLIRSVPTGSNSVFALEFSRPDRTFAYAVWTSRGTASLKFDFGGGILEKLNFLWPDKRISNVDFYGRPLAFRGRIMASEAAQYLWTPTPVKKISIGKQTYTPEVSLRDFRVIKTARMAADWEIVAEADPFLEVKPGQVWLPYLKKGKAELRTVKDQEKGICLELEIQNLDNLPAPFQEYAVIRLKDPVQLSGKPDTCGLWVKGNSGWGQIFWEFTDATGRRLLSAGRSANADISDYEGRRCINFDGWYHIAFPLSEKSPIIPTSTGFANEWSGDITQLQYPLTLTGIGFAAPAKALLLNKRIPIQQVIRIKEITCR